MTVEEFAKIEGILEWVDYGEHDRTDVEVWIKECWLDPQPMIDRYNKLNKGLSHN